LAAKLNCNQQGRRKMKLKAALILPAIMGAVTVMAAFSAGTASADEPGRHPYYMHALSDLHAAQWMIDHRRPEDGAVADDEMVARDEIGAAFHEIKRAAYFDGKDMRFDPAPDVYLAREGRLHQAIDLLRRARTDVAREEDDPDSRGLQHRALEHMDAALRAAERAVGEARRHDRME
jgi:hypothetical protein